MEKEEKKIFNEQTLGEEIKKQWGEFGAHYEVFKMLLKRVSDTNIGNTPPNLDNLLEAEEKDIPTVIYLQATETFLCRFIPALSNQCRRATRALSN